MFNNLGLQITPSPVYHNFGEKLKADYDRHWNHTKATLRTVYFSDIWRWRVAAVILLVLTVVQTEMEMKRVKRWTYEDFDPEEIEEAHNSKANILEMEKDVIARPVSESKEFRIDIEKISEAIFDGAPECCIYRVPRDLRKINEEAYTPQVVSIGPLHHGKREYLIEMEKQKLIYVKKFSERTSTDKLKELKSFIEDNEQRIRICYAENPNLLSDEFVTMILYDAVFIIELFLRNDEAKNKTGFDSLLVTPIRKAAIKLDLQLLENQLPYFILEELFLLGDVAKPSGEGHDPLLILASRFFFDSELDLHKYNKYDLRHFTDLRRCFLLKEFIPPKNINKHIRDLPYATKLDGSGVKFKKGSEDRSSLDISCEYIMRSTQIIPFIKVQELELQIPRLEVYDGTECLIRNVMAFEQLHYPWETHVCNYILLLDFLIDTEKDVDLLVEKDIIFNCLGDNAAIANMFNKLGFHVTPSYSGYYEVTEKLKAHYGNRWNHSKATLKRVYFSDPWIGTGTVVAVLLLLLTLVQTVCSILQVL
ncbi:hypothetical protein Dsin_032544 [Dipteronia sinensis]|uniref:Uncharacterized protein n=1 Tax=Dipteronia sinensis TaxID=43782 RepID=A0AAD9ZA96_9ROSI|nr:hypothetical protein Dsin_032544 [Dipteronia sinensis]